MSHQQRKKDRARLKNCSTSRQLIEEAITMAEARGDRMAVANLQYTRSMMIAQDCCFAIPSADATTLLGDDMSPSQMPSGSLLIKNPRGGSV